ncbi:hypothetical protein [Mycolicibacterium palauense]|uniref:hypothetical protein n=1 Tax=Mycolicibacterium palauense TaxID=2034511 RepID=UPI00114597E6|nr:hypothetical protein [Mycolicibacterium palauense]
MSDETTPRTGLRHWLTWVLAAGLVALFAVACWLLYQAAAQPDMTETLWARYIYVFGALEAIVFTAVGWLFGREVHRSTAEFATEDAARTRRENEEIRQHAAAVEDQAEKGRALAEAVKASVGALGGIEGIGGAHPQVESTPSQLISLKQMADNLFP